MRWPSSSRQPGFCVVLCCVVLCCVVLCCVVLCCVVSCGVMWGGVVWCFVPLCVPGGLPTGTGKREGSVCKRALCACVLLYSRDRCTVALGRCCVDARARPHKVYWAHCTMCAALHYRYFVCGAALLGVGHCTAPCVACCTAFVGSGQWKRRYALPLCLWAGGNGTPATRCLTACGQWAVEIVLCTDTLPGGIGQGNGIVAVHCLTACG